MQNERHALIFAATGAIAQGVARALAAQGATLWLAGRDERVSAVANVLREETGATVHTALVDATDADQVSGFIHQVRSQAGRIDSVFNGIGGAPRALAYPRRTIDASVGDFLLPIQRIVGSQFLTAREAGRVMIAQKSGAIVTLSATLSGMTAANMAGITATCGAVEAMTRALAGDFGPYGIRVNCVRGSAMPETRTIQQTAAGQAAIADHSGMMASPMRGFPITVAETSAAAAFLASPAASGVHGQVLTVCAGQFVGQG